MSLFHLVRKIIFIRIILKFLNEEQSEPTCIFLDSKSAIDVSKFVKNNDKVGSIATQIQTIREALNNREIKLVFIRIELNCADALTKSLPIYPFEIFRDMVLKIVKQFKI
jgi:hypothetical protein